MPAPALTLIRAALQLALLVSIFVPAERLWPVRPQLLMRKGVAKDVALSFVNPVLINAGAAVTLGAIALGVRHVIPAAFPNAIGRQPFLVQLLEVLVLSELCLYLAHRAMHRVPFLWKLHSVHHSSETLDFLSTPRQHPLDAIFHIVMGNLPALVLGFPLSTLAGFVLLQRVHTVFVHSNIKTRLGWLGNVIASPQFHHFHHAVGQDTTNFGALTPLFDRIFGTLNRERGSFPSRYGEA